MGPGEAIRPITGGEDEGYATAGKGVDELAGHIRVEHGGIEPAAVEEVERLMHPRRMTAQPRSVSMSSS